MTDMINPDHYKGDRQFEPISVIEDWDLNYNLGNALKYISRNGRKPGEDLEEGLSKAVWYLEREIKKIRSERAIKEVSYDEVYEFFMEEEIPFDGSDSVDLWDPSTGPQEPEYAGNYEGPLYAPHPDLAGKDLDQFEDDEIVRIFTRRGVNIGVFKDGSSCELGENGKCH